MDAKERQFLEAKIHDAVRRCNSQSVPQFVGFLDSAGAGIATSVAIKEKTKFILFGRYKSAERVYFGAFPDWCEPDSSLFPMIRLKIINKSSRELSHRDVLGAFMSAGVERDTIGDILTGDGNTLVFVSSTVAKHLTAHIIKIASAGVEIVEDKETEINIVNRFEELSGTVASMRLDCVVAELCNCSRNKDSVFIESGMVAVGGLEVLKLTFEVSKDDVISVRRAGKFVIDECDRLTKKGRIALKYRKYI